MTSRLIYSTVIYAAGEQRELDSCIAVSANCGERERRSSGSHGSLVATRPRGTVCHHSFPSSAGTGHTAPCRRWIDLTRPGNTKTQHVARVDGIKMENKTVPPGYL